MIFFPSSALATRLAAPISVGLQFIDSHWKAALFVGALLFIPNAGELFRRVRKVIVGPVSVELLDGVVGKKPHHDERD